MSALLLLRPTTCRKHNLKKEQVSFATEMAEDICKLLKDYALWLAAKRKKEKAAKKKAQAEAAA